MPHGSNIYAKASDMAKATMCSYTQSDHELPCCSKFPSVNLSDQETDYQYSDTRPSILFHIYHLIARCKTRGRLPLNYK